MISKNHRFHGHNSLNPVYKHGQSLTLSQISLKTLPVRLGREYRISVVVSKKVNKSAVIRNRIRRRIYENLRIKIENIKEMPDVVVNVYNEQVASMPSSQLDKIINELLVKAGLLTSVKESDRDIVNVKLTGN